MAPSPPTAFRGRRRTLPTKDNTFLTIPSDASTSTPAPTHAAAPERGDVEQGIKARKRPRSGTRTRSGSPSVHIITIQAGTRPTRVSEQNKKPVTPARKGLADTSDSPAIRPCKGLPTRGAYYSATQPPSTLTPALTPHEKGEKSRVATPSAATPDRGKGS